LPKKNETNLPGQKGVTPLEKNLIPTIFNQYFLHFSLEEIYYK